MTPRDPAVPGDAGQARPDQPGDARDARRASASSAPSSGRRHEEERFDDASRDLFDTSLRVNRLFAMTIPTMTAIFNLSTVAVIWFGAMRVERGEPADRQPDRVPPVPAADPVRGPDRRVHVHPRSRARRSRRAGSGRSCDTEPIDPRPGATRRPAPIRADRGVVEFRDVEFRYPGAEQPVLRDISFRARPGRDDGDRRQHRQRQVDAHQPHPALLRRDAAARCSSTASTSAS